MSSHELRISTPKDFPVRATFGGFTELQTDAYMQNYAIPGLADAQKRDQLAGHVLFDQ